MPAQFPLQDSIVKLGCMLSHILPAVKDDMQQVNEKMPWEQSVWIMGLTGG